MGNEIKIVAEINSPGGSLEQSVGHLKEFRDLMLQIKQNKDALGSAESIANVKKLTAELKKAELQVSALQAKEQERAAKAHQKAKEEDSAYKQLNDTWKESMKIARDMATQELRASGQISEATKKQIAEANIYRQTLVAVDSALGVHTRNVGNYDAQLKTLSKSLRGLGGLGRIFAESMGLPPEVFQGITEAGRALRDLEHIKQAETLSTEESTSAKKAEIIVNEQVAESQTLLIPILGAVVLGLGALIAIGIRYKEQLFGLTEAQKDKMRADDGALISDDKLREQYNKSIKTIRDLEVEYGVLTGRVSEFEGELIKLRNKNQDALDDVSKDTKKKLEETGGWWGALKFSIAQSVGLGNLEAKHQLDEMGHIIEDDAKVKAKLKEQLTEEEKVALAKKYKDIDDYTAKVIEKMRKKQEEDAKKAAEERKKELEKEFNAFNTYWDKVDAEERKREKKRQIDELNQQQKDAEEKIKKAEDMAKEIDDADAESEKAFATLEDKTRERTRKNKEKQRKEDIAELKQHTDTIFNILQESANAQKDLDELQLKWKQELIDTQVKLAIAGKANNLGKAEADKAALEKQALDQQKKLTNLKKLETYYNLFAAYARDAKNGEESQAARKAFTDVILGEVLSRAFAEKGGIGEDITDTTQITSRGLSKSHGGGNDMTVVMSKKEGILTEQEIEALGGKRGFYMLKDLLKNPVKDDFMEKQEQSFARVIPIYKEEGASNEVVQAIEGMTDELRSIPRISQGIDGMGNIMTRESTKGLIRQTLRKARQI